MKYLFRYTASNDPSGEWMILFYERLLWDKVKSNVQQLRDFDKASIFLFLLSLNVIRNFINT